MAWSYADYEEQSTDALRLAQLRRHITEVGEAIRANTMSGGDRRESDHLELYLKDVLQPRRKELEVVVNATATTASGAPLRCSFTKARMLR